MAAAVAAGYKVVPVPGPAAVLAGLVGSALSTEEFYFVGFLPAKAGARQTKLKAIRDTITVSPLTDSSCAV